MTRLMKLIIKYDKTPDKEYFDETLMPRKKKNDGAPLVKILLDNDNVIPEEKH